MIDINLWVLGHERLGVDGDHAVEHLRPAVAHYLGLTQETLSRVIRQLLTTGEVVAKGPRMIVLRRPTVSPQALEPDPQAAA